MKSITENAQKILASLKKTATQTLERKRRLGQYAVVWKDGEPVAVGDDAPNKENQNNEIGSAHQ
ncbi:MAG: hypothetical protein HC799_19270 [Limnothrix sp. RL_2_0]|nr:hypothetical protein [Limnothrix sp. RL_2_0]